MKPSDFPTSATLPNFLIVGAPKCGTTAVAAQLARHPDVYCSKIKEPNFFTAPEVKKLYYRAPIISDPAEYAKLFTAGKGKKVVFEASTSYLYYPEAPKRIWAALGPIKILILVRDPIERAYSHYLMDRSMGCAPAASFGEIIRKPDKYPLHYSQYIYVSKYDEQIQRYINTFGKENVLTIDQRQLLDNAEMSINSISVFLDIDASANKTNSKKRYNTKKMPRIPILKSMVNTNTYLRYGQIMPVRIKRIAKLILFKDIKINDTIPNTDKDYLQGIFEKFHNAININ